MYLKINQSVIKPCRRPGMGVALSGLWALDTARQFQQFLFKRDLARSCDIMFLIVLCSFWLYFSKPFLLLVRKNPRKNWKNDCLHLTIISNKMTNILEVSQFCYFFQVEHLWVCSLYNPNYCFPTTSVFKRQGRFWTKKITLSPRLSPVTSSPSPPSSLFSTLFFTFFDGHLLSGDHLGKFKQTTRMAGLPVKIFIQ